MKVNWAPDNIRRLKWKGRQYWLPQGVVKEIKFLWQPSTPSLKRGYQCDDLSDWFPTSVDMPDQRGLYSPIPRMRLLQRQRDIDNWIAGYVTLPTSANMLRYARYTSLEICFAFALWYILFWDGSDELYPHPSGLFHWHLDNQRQWSSPAGDGTCSSVPSQNKMQRSCMFRH